MVSLLRDTSTTDTAVKSTRESRTLVIGEVAEMLYQFQRPLIVSHDKFAAAFETATTPYDEALEETIERYRDTASNTATEKAESTTRWGP